MINPNNVISYFKEVATSIKFQISASLTFGIALLLVWLKENNDLRIILTILFLFPALMLICSLVEKIFIFYKKKKDQKFKKVYSKLGNQNNCQFTDILTDLWKDKDFEGLGWQIHLNTPIRSAYLTQPCCYNCKTDLLVRTNSKSDGFYLECTDCSEKFDVDDIGLQRSMANASFQGDVRRNSSHYF